MFQNDSDELGRALKSLEKLGIASRGPFSTSKGEIVVIEDKILLLSEVLDLFSQGRLNRDGIRELCLAGRSK